MIARAAAALLALAGAAQPVAAQTVLIAGDSTAAALPEDRYPEMGWGVMLGCGLGGLQVRNHAMGGRSTRTFLNEGRWDALLKEMQPGDIVLIQFGHNDASRNKPERFAAAETTYRDNLLRMVREVRAGQGVPVLLTPVTRRSFDDGGKAKADFAEYSAVVRTVAQETRTPLLDLERRSRNWLDGLGTERSTDYFLPDNTHFKELGARQVADIVAGELRTLKLPISGKIPATRPDLTRATPLGKGVCR